MKDIDKMTRAQAEHAIVAGADPRLFEAHKNYHVRSKALRKQGKLVACEPWMMADLAKRIRPNHVERLDLFFKSLAKLFSFKA